MTTLQPSHSPADAEPHGCQERREFEELLRRATEILCQQLTAPKETARNAGDGGSSI
jgi:hypothetical protein